MAVVREGKLRRKRLSEELTARLRQHIIDQGLKPGDPLLTEGEMVERFGVSRTVVREATKTLDCLGIISASPRRGTVLEEFDFDRVGNYFGFHFALCNYSKEVLLKSRMVIELGTLPYVIEAMKKDAGLYPRLRDLAESAGDVNQIDDRWIQHDIAFHRGLVEASGVAPLVSMCDLLQAFFQRFREEMGDLPLGKKEHLWIVEALHGEKLDAAVRLLRHHLSRYERNPT